MSVTPVRSSGSSVLRSILDEISVPMAVLKEARARRDRVLSIAYGHYAVRARYSSGSVAYGPANRPLEDADGGVKRTGASRTCANSVRMPRGAVWAPVR